jgi:hypothetical protein
LACVDEVWTPDGWRLHAGDRAERYAYGNRFPVEQLPIAAQMAARKSNHVGERSNLINLTRQNEGRVSNSGRTGKTYRFEGALTSCQSLGSPLNLAFMKPRRSIAFSDDDTLISISFTSGKVIRLRQSELNRVRKSGTGSRQAAREFIAVCDHQRAGKPKKADSALKTPFRYQPDSV